MRGGEGRGERKNTFESINNDWTSCDALIIFEKFSLSIKICKEY